MTATQREGLSDAALALTQPVIDELLKDIARRIKDAGAITDTAEYQIYRAQALGESKQAIKAAVARQIKAQDKVIDSLFDYILDNSTPLTANGSLKQIAEGYAKMSRQKTAEQLKNLWADTPQGKVLPIQDAYAKALDFAFRQTVTGALDTETAIRRACAPLAKRGLRTIEQKSGRSVGIEYACRRYLMDQLGELDDEVQQVTHDELGCDGWEISAHLACAPDHEPYQGRQYSDAEYEKLNNSLQRRIGHLKLWHSAAPSFWALNAPQYTEEQRWELADANERGRDLQRAALHAVRGWAGAEPVGKRRPHLQAPHFDEPRNRRRQKPEEQPDPPAGAAKRIRQVLQSDGPAHAHRAPANGRLWPQRGEQGSVGV